MDNVFDLNSRRKQTLFTNIETEYRRYINNLDKLELMSEMVSFQEKRSLTGYLTPEMMIRGKILFKALHESAETDELRLLTRSYARHLDYEFQQYLKTGKI